MFRLCEHILTTGVRCKSPALRKDVFCYFHTAFRRQQRELAHESTRPPEFVAPQFNQHGEFMRMYPVQARDFDATRGVIRKPIELDLGLLEDAAAIQLAISNVLHALALGRLDHGRARLLLYGLQLASNNCRGVNPAESGTCELDPSESGTCESDPAESGICERAGEGRDLTQP